MIAETPENAQLRRRDARKRNERCRKPLLFDGKRQKDRRDPIPKAGTGTKAHPIAGAVTPPEENDGIATRLQAVVGLTGYGEKLPVQKRTHFK